MTVGGHLVGPSCIKWSRVKDPASLPAAQRKPNKLMVQLPRLECFKNPGSSSYATFTISKTLLEKRSDGTWGVKVGEHFLKSRFDNDEMIKVEIFKIDG